MPIPRTVRGLGNGVLRTALPQLTVRTHLYRIMVSRSRQPARGIPYVVYPGTNTSKRT